MSKKKDSKQRKDNLPLLKERQDVAQQSLQSFMLSNLEKCMERTTIHDTVETKKGTLLQVVPRERQDVCFCRHSATTTGSTRSLDDLTSSSTHRKKNKQKKRNHHRCSSLNHQPQYYQKQVATPSRNEARLQNNTNTKPSANNLIQSRNSWMPQASERSASLPIQNFGKIMKEQKLGQRLLKNYLQVQQSPILSSPKSVSLNINFINELSAAFQLPYVSSKASDIYTLKNINPYSYDPMIIKNLFDKTMLSYKITSFKCVENRFLLLHYLLNKASSYCCSELLLYHGTKIENLDSICIDNFDWRMVSRHKYGWGVSFSSTPFYASHYSDESGSVKAMFAVKVLKNREWFGDCNTEVPESPFDTTTNLSDNVYVKYDDCCFYPAYLIYYTRK